MRVTNTMISNSARSHISGAKNKLLKYEEQYTSQKKIQRPSDDPTVAVRSLKLRTTYSQLTQYVEKNVKDAMDWMDATETAMENIGSLITNMKGYFNQGANDSYESGDRNSILSALKQYDRSIFEDEANSDYAGRYVFTGYRTDTPLLFMEDKTNLSYKITEEFKYDNIRSTTAVLGGATYNSSFTNGQAYVDQAPTTKKIYHLMTAYDDCSNVNNSGDGATTDAFSITAKDKLGNDVALGANNIKVAKSTDDDKIRDVQPDEVRYLYDTGEILIGETVYQTIQANQATLSVDYCKDKFLKEDIRPEMYFKCSAHDSISGKDIKYAKPDDQQIRYEINFSQTLSVNTQARDAVSLEMHRTIDYIEKCIEYVDEVEAQMTETKKMIDNENDKDKKAVLESLQGTLEEEKKLRQKVLTEAFGMGLTALDNTQQTLSVAVAELGAKYKRAQLTHDKLLDQRTDTEENLSDNEDVSLTDVYINLSQADNLYQASLSSTAKILGNSLLNYI